MRNKCPRHYNRHYCFRWTFFPQKHSTSRTLHGWTTVIFFENPLKHAPFDRWESDENSRSSTFASFFKILEYLSDAEIKINDDAGHDFLIKSVRGERTTQVFFFFFLYRHVLYFYRYCMRYIYKRFELNIKIRVHTWP